MGRGSCSSWITCLLLAVSWAQCASKTADECVSSSNVAAAAVKPGVALVQGNVSSRRVHGVLAAEKDVADVDHNLSAHQSGEWICQVCDHVYSPGSDGGGKSFDQLPDTWTCPICGASKSAFKYDRAIDAARSQSTPAVSTDEEKPRPPAPRPEPAPTLKSSAKGLGSLWLPALAVGGMVH
uniref:Rubredoxin-like domain-containing protein n=1 Tax=Alexandrium monilatum TaxID=311494 RepID=A0A7S4PZK3_9DINO